MEFNSVYEAVCHALNRHGYPRPKYGKWIRIPAVWRGSKDPNVSVNSETGWTRDFTPDESYNFATLMDANHLGIPEIRITGTVKKQTRISIKEQIKKSLDSVNQLWDRGVSLNDESSQAARICRKYLSERGIPDGIIQSLGGSVKAIALHDGAVMVTPIVELKTNKRTGLQRLYLDSNGKKSNGSESRRMIGFHMQGDIAGGFIIGSGGHRLNRTLLVCEGFETGLALFSATGQTVFVSYNAGGMERIDIESLSKLGYSDIVICGDNDLPDKYGVKRGQKASWVLAARFFNEFNRKVRIAIPFRKKEEFDQKSVDWLDVYRKDRIGCKESIQKSIIHYDPANDIYKLEENKLPELRTRKFSPLG